MSTVRQIWSILTPHQRRTGAVLLAMVIVGTALETFSVGLVVPALAFMTRGSHEPSPRMARWLDWLGNPSANQLILWMLLGLLGVYAVKAVFLLVVAFCETRFISKTQSGVSRRLFAVFLTQPWTFHLQRHTADLMRTIHQTAEFAHVCRLFLMTVSEVLVLCGLVGLLLWFEPTGALVVAGMLGAAAWLFNTAVRSRGHRWAQAQSHHAKMVIQHLQQGLGGAKDVKIRGCEREFLEQFGKHAEGAARVTALQMLVLQVPRLWFEFLAVAALFLLTAVMVWHGTPSERLIPMLGLFATVAFRMLPSVNHVTAAVQKLRHSDVMLENLQNSLRLAHEIPAGRPATPMRFRECIVLETVRFRYPRSGEDVLDAVSISIPHGALVGIVGGSGAGKSTLLDVVLGLLPPTAGRVTVDGEDIQANLRGWQDTIGYVPQSIYLYDDSIRRNVAFGVPEADIDDGAVRRALKAAQLDAFVDGLPAGADTFVGELGSRLSGGQKQRIGIARALYHDPQVLVLDEATSALDAETEKEVMAAVNALHGAKTMIIVAHRLTTVASCDLIYRIDKGRVVQSGTAAEVIST
jgi:ABC-type multidrug transport system fused ATPase/permease subunit